MPNLTEKLNRLTSTGVNYYQHHTNDFGTTSTLQTNDQDDRILPSDPNRPITSVLPHLSLTGNNITAKLTNQSIRTVLKKFERYYTIHLTLLMNSAQVGETLLTTTDNSPSQNYLSIALTKG